MDSIADMGGMDGFGKVEVEKDEPVFHAPWEGRVLALARAMGYGGGWQVDHHRYAQERIAPKDYLTFSYYERWAIAMETIVIEQGLVGADELAAGRALRPGRPLQRKLTPEKIHAAKAGLIRGSSFRQPQEPALFKVGDRVRTRNIHPKMHTRLPQYARGKVGAIEREQGCHMFPDTVAIEQGDCPQWLYTVVFDNREIWGADADPTVRVSIDAFEPYLEPA